MGELLKALKSASQPTGPVAMLGPPAQGSHRIWTLFFSSAGKYFSLYTRTISSTCSCKGGFEGAGLAADSGDAELAAKLNALDGVIILLFAWRGSGSIWLPSQASEET